MGNIALILKATHCLRKSFYYVSMKPTSGLCHTISSEHRATPVVAYSGVKGVRAGFVCLTTSAPAHPPNGQGPQSGESEIKALDTHFC